MLDSKENVELKEGKMDKEKIKRAVRDILEAIGEDPDREGLKETPGSKRAFKSYFPRGITRGNGYS